MQLPSMNNLSKLLGLLIIAVLAISVSGCTSNTPTPSPSPTVTTAATATSKASAGPVSLSITSPANNTQVGYNPSVAGKAGQISKGQKLWVVVYVYKTNRYYPQSGCLTPQSNSDWSCKAYLGTQSVSKGQKFDLIAVLADQNANSAFAQYQAYSQQANSNAGLTQLPSGIVAQNQVTVTTAP